jgi:hypothetical protein
LFNKVFQTEPVKKSLWQTDESETPFDGSLFTGNSVCKSFKWRKHHKKQKRLLHTTPAATVLRSTVNQEIINYSVCILLRYHAEWWCWY